MVSYCRKFCCDVTLFSPYAYINHFLRLTHNKVIGITLFAFSIVSVKFQRKLLSA